MKKQVLALITAFGAHACIAAPVQLITEAEKAAGGTVVTDGNASGGQAVIRSTDGIYMWWVLDTRTLTTGSYSVYVRVALAPGVNSSRSLGVGTFYNDAQIGYDTVSVSNHAYKWIRVSSFELTQTGSQLRLSDWSGAGLSVDKVAILKDAAVEAESVAGGTVIFDASASGAKAVTSASSSGGIYTWWLPAASDLTPGDYTVYASLASIDGAPHNFGENLVIDEVTKGVVDATVSSTSYQWVKLNEFSYGGPGQTLRLSDWSTSGLKVDRLKMVRNTPFDENSAIQTLFAGGDVALAEREDVVFLGSPDDVPSLQPQGRASFVQADASTVYAYFRQNITPNVKDEHYQMYVAVSTDGGKTFNVVPEPIIKVSPDLGTAYDPHVTKRADGYYMVFEGYGFNCFNSAMAAYSPDGLHNWTVTSVPVCAQGDLVPNDTLGLKSVGSGSVPNYYVDVENNTQYIQWASVNARAGVAQRYQIDLPNGLGQRRITFTTAEQMQPYMIARSAPGTWDYVNTGAGSTMYEDGYYYTVYEGATTSECNSQWGLGMMRSSTPGDVNSWRRSEKNPFMLAGKADSCWLGSPSLVKINGDTYLYYTNPLVYYGTTKVIFRHKLIQK